MGWGRGKFPHFDQLNVLSNPRNMPNTQQFFIATYGRDGMGTDEGTKPYKVGDLCYDWDDTKTPDSPWKGAPADPYHGAEANEWKIHCQGDLQVPNHSTGNTVEEDLTNWIRDAILAGDRIFYKFHRDDEVPDTWMAERRRRGRDMWVITVTGPGWP